MSVSSLISKLKSNRIIAIDPASHSLAWAILDINHIKIDIIAYGKIDFASVPEISNKFDIIKDQLPVICDEYNPTAAVIEQSVYIQNFQASRILSYIIGLSWGELLNFCETVQDVNPLQWKSGIGYKNITKAESKLMEETYGKRGIQQRLTLERKNRVKAILSKNIENIDFESMDSDISDAIGIGLWYAVSHGFRTVQR